MSELDDGTATDTATDTESDERADLEDLEDTTVPLESDPADWQEQQLEVPDPDPDDAR